MKSTRTCWDTAINLLTRREHSRTELTQKLKLRDFGSEEIEKTLYELEKLGLQSNARFAGSYMRMRRDKGFGPIKIKYELMEKGIDKDLIDEIVDENSEEWLECVKKTYHKKFGKTTPQDFQEKNKQINFLAYKGFSFEQIKKAFD